MFGISLACIFSRPPRKCPPVRCSPAVRPPPLLQRLRVYKLHTSGCRRRRRRQRDRRYRVSIKDKSRPLSHLLSVPTTLRRARRVRPHTRSPVDRSVRPSARPSVSPFVHRSVRPSVRPSVCPSDRRSVCPSVSRSVRPSRPSVRPSRSSVRPSVRPSVWPSGDFVPIAVVRPAGELVAN